MINFWAVIGAACLHKDFHIGLFRWLKEPPADFQIWLDACGFPLSRMEITDLRELFGSDVNSALVRIRSICGHGEDGCDDSGIPAFRRPTPTFYAVVGLACIDGAFRDKIWKADSGVRVQAKLKRGPCLKLDDRSLCEEIHEIFAKTEVIMLFDSVQKQGWWHTEKVYGACKQGYTLTDVAFADVGSEEQAGTMLAGEDLGELLDAKRTEAREDVHAQAVKSRFAAMAEELDALKMMLDKDRQRPRSKTPPQEKPADH